MDPNTTDVLLATAAFVSLVALTQIIADHITTRKVLGAHLSDTGLRDLLRWTKDVSRQSSLKWGLAAVAIGAALILVDQLPIKAASPTGFGIVIIAAGSSLLGYYALAHRGRKDS